MREFRVGDKVVLTKGGRSGNRKLGKGGVFVICGMCKDRGIIKYYITTEWGGGSYPMNEYGEIVRGCPSYGYVFEDEMSLAPQSNDNLDAQLEDAILKVTDIKLRISWMKENDDVFDENAFKLYKTLKLMENSELSMVEKCNMLAKF